MLIESPLGLFGVGLLSSALTLATLFSARGQTKIWVWAMFCGALGLAVGGFGYMIPSTIPHANAIILAGVGLMCAGKFISYQISPIDPSFGPEVRVLIVEQRVNGLRLLGLGATVTAIFAGYFAYSMLNSDKGDFRDVIGGISGLARQFNVMNREIVGIKQRLDNQDNINKKDSIFKKQVLDNQNVSLANQEIGLANQANVKRDLKQANAKLNRSPPMIITTPTPRPLPPSNFKLPGEVKTPDVSKPKKYRLSVENEPVYLLADSSDHYSRITKR